MDALFGLARERCVLLRGCGVDRESSTLGTRPRSLEGRAHGVGKVLEGLLLVRLERRIRRSRHRSARAEERLKSEEAAVADAVSLSPRSRYLGLRLGVVRIDSESRIVRDTESRVSSFRSAPRRLSFRSLERSIPKTRNFPLRKDFLLNFIGFFVESNVRRPVKNRSDSFRPARFKPGCR